jgi:LmbE family N-acetylglucosaminyl deacetylase
LSSKRLQDLRVLAVFPHPDDEAWAAGGLLQRAGEARLVTLTRGEAGRDGLADRRGEALAAARVAELALACEALGIAPPTVLGLADGALEATAAAAKLGPIVEAFRPDVVLSFDHDGGSGHVDHVAGVRATLLAAGDACVLGAAFPAGMLEPLRRAFGRRRPELLHPAFEATPLGRAAADLVLRLGPEEARRKREAIGAHASQLRSPGDAGVDGFLGPGVVARLLVEERWVVLSGSWPR